MSTAQKPPPVASAVDAKDRFISNLKVLFDVIASAAEELIADGYKGVVNPTLIRFAKLGIFELADINKTDIVLTFLKSSYAHWDKIVNEDLEFVEQNVFNFVLPDEHKDDEKAKALSERCKEIASSILGCKDINGKYALKKKYLDKVIAILKSFISLSTKYVFFLMKPHGCIRRSNGEYTWSFDEDLEYLKHTKFNINTAIRHFNVKDLPTSV